MLQQKIEPNIVSYGTAISACARGGGFHRTIFFSLLLPLECTPALLFKSSFLFSRRCDMPLLYGSVEFMHKFQQVLPIRCEESRWSLLLSWNMVAQSFGYPWIFLLIGLSSGSAPHLAHSLSPSPPLSAAVAAASTPTRPCVRALLPAFLPRHLTKNNTHTHTKHEKRKGVGKKRCIFWPTYRLGGSS